MSGGTRRPESAVEIRLSADGQRAYLEVVDDGPGIAEEDRARIFRPFERGRTTARGSGLGLSIARGLAEAHGGALDVKRSPLEAPQFCLTLPL